jgi:hypothetical protein
LDRLAALYEILYLPRIQAGKCRHSRPKMIDQLPRVGCEHDLDVSFAWYFRLSGRTDHRGHFPHPSRYERILWR